MKKFITKLDSGLCFTIETDGDKTQFFGLVYGEPYVNRKDVTPKVGPNKTIINEITDRATWAEPMSDGLKNFVAELEKNYHGA